MERVVLEQCMTPPIRIADIAAMEQKAAWCMQQYRVRHESSLLAADGLRLLCLFDAPDAEALRQVLHQLGESYERLWAASLHAPPQVPLGEPLPLGDAALVVVERSFTTPVEFESIQAIKDRSPACMDAHRIRFLRSYFATDRRRMICLYAAPDAESVRIAEAQARMPLDRVWAATLYESPPE